MTRTIQLVAVLCLLSLGGCVQSEMVIMKNPATGEVIRCERNSGPSLFPIAQTMMDNTAARSCAEGYQRAGWQRMN
jgi:hypothetical protein